MTVEATPEAVPTAAETPAEGGAEPSAQAKPETADKPPSEPSKVQQALAAKRAERERRRTQERAEFDRRARDDRARLDALEQQLSAAKTDKELLALAKSDPAAFAQQVGLDFNALTESTLKAGTDSAKIAALEKRWAERDAADKRAKEEAERAQREAAYQEANRRFVAAARDGDKYPELSVYDDDEIAQAGEMVALRLYEATGKAPTFADVAAELEKIVSAKHDRVEAARSKRRAAKQAAEEAKQATEDKDKKATKTTLSARDGAETSGRQRPTGVVDREEDLTRALANALPDFN